MRATIDKAGRLVIPEPLRDRLGLRPGDVVVTADGNALRVEPVVDDSLESAGEWLVIPAAGEPLTAEPLTAEPLTAEPLTAERVRELRDLDQR